MSVLASRALRTLFHSESFELDGRRLIGKRKVTDTLLGLLRGAGATSKQANNTVRAAWNQVLQGHQPETSSALAPFVGVYYALRVCNTVGYHLTVDDLPGFSQAVDLDSAELAIVPAGADPQPPQPQEILDDEEPEIQGSAPPAAKRRRQGFASRQPQDEQLVQRRRETSEAVRQEEEALRQLPVNALVRKVLQHQTTARNKDKRILVLQNKVRNLNRQLQTSRRQAAAKSEELQIFQESQNVFALEKLGRQHAGRAGRWSLRSRFSMGLRCSLCTVAAADFSMLVMEDVSKQTVLRAECMSGAAIIHLMRSFCSEGLGVALESAQSPDEWSVFGVGYRSDATNTNIWRRKKLHVLEARVLFLSSPQKLKEGDFSAAMSTRSCVFLVWR